MFLDDIRSLYNYKDDHISFLKLYSKLSDDLMFQDYNFINEVVDYLKTETINIAAKNPIYILYDYVDKASLLDKCLWYNSEIPFFTNTTSGSTGHKFEYRIWKEIYNNIEGASHYGAIAKEFKINKAKILYFHQDLYDPESDSLITVTKSNNPLISFGLYQQAEIHWVVTNKAYVNNPYKYFQQIIEYCIHNEIDIIHTKSNIVSSLAWNIKRLNIDRPICKLLSNTGSKLDLNDINILTNRGAISNWCDHMRCWDGGVTFYTCAHNTYHLMDGLSFAYSDNYKLRSIDYFSLPSLFVNYWNGDYASINNSYQRCCCGRAYRPFIMGRTRSITSAIVSDSQIITDVLEKNGVLNIIKRVDVVDSHMRFITLRTLPKEDKYLLKSLFPSAIIDFSVEEEI